MNPELIIMVGNIASGKSTWIKRFLASDAGRSYIAVSKDALRIMMGGGNYNFDENLEPLIHAITIETIMILMAEGRNIIYDETNMDVGSRQQILLLTKKFNHNLGYDYHIKAVVMPKLIKFASLLRKFHFIARNPNQEQDLEVWEKVWERKDKLFVTPTFDEGFDNIENI